MLGNARVAENAVTPTLPSTSAAAAAAAASEDDAAVSAFLEELEITSHAPVLERPGPSTTFSGAQPSVVDDSIPLGREQLLLNMLVAAGGRDNTSYEMLAQLSDVVVPASPSVIARLPRIKVEPAPLSSCTDEQGAAEGAAGGKGEACPICLDPMHTDVATVLPTCQHQFHLACITQWLKCSKKCCVCKMEVF